MNSRAGESRTAPRPFQLIAPVAEESEEQAALITWARSPLVLRQYPGLKFLIAIPNGMAAASIGVARRMKEQGMTAGVPDLFLPCPQGGYHGLWIELKRRAGGRVSQTQREWIKDLNRLGYRAEVCRGWDAARETLLAYLATPATSASLVSSF